MHFASLEKKVQGVFRGEIFWKMSVTWETSTNYEKIHAMMLVFKSV